MKSLKSRLHLFIAVALLVGCGSSTSAPAVPQEVPPAPVPLPQPTPTPVPEPVPPPQPDPFVRDVTFHVYLHNEDGRPFDGLSLSLFRAGVEVQRVQVSNGLAVIPQMLPGEVEVRLLGLSLLHTFTPFIVGVTNESKDFLVLVSLRDHGHSVLFGDSNTSEGGKIPTTFRKHLEEDQNYATALDYYETQIDNLAKGGTGLTNVWGDDATYGAELVRKYFNRLDREGGTPPLFALYRFGLIDVRNRWHPDDFEEELRGIVELALGHGVMPVLNYVSYQQGGRDEAAITQCNEIFARVAAEYDLPLVDTALQWSEELYYKDGEHQSDAGNEVLASAAGEAIARWLTASH